MPSTLTTSQTTPNALENVVRIGHIVPEDALELLARYGLHLHLIEDGAPIPGSYWGEPEAGIIGCNVYVRNDTPVHSMLHEACHLIVLPPEQRATVHTNATNSSEEEDATCYLQIVLADALPGSTATGSCRIWMLGDIATALGQRGRGSNKMRKMHATG